MTRRWITLLPFILLVAACSAVGPRQIASYPADSREIPRSGLLPSEYVYDAYLEIEVRDPVSSASRSKELAEDHGGYLVSSQTYQWDNKEQVTVLLAVPAANFDRLEEALKRLGTVRSERISGEWDGSSWKAYSEITVNFQPSAWALPDLPNGWNPGRTFRRAGEVFITVFGFLVDVLIWVMVVLGPFALLAVGAWALRRRLRGSNRS